MNEKEIKKILQEIYELDGRFRSREKELMGMIRALAITPEAKIDPLFMANLRRRLLAELSLTEPRKINLTNTMSNMKYIFAGVAVFIVAGLAIFLTLPQAKPNNNISLLSGVTVTKVGDNAFGSLSASNTAASNSGAGAVSPVASSPMMATGKSAAMAIGQGSGAMGPMILPINPGAQPTYVYKGDAINQDQAKLDVLKKTPASFSAGQAVAALSQAGLGMVDLSSFTNADLTNITLSENQDFGYTVYVDLANGSISINQNWDKWPQGQSAPLTASDIPSDDTVIGIANQFLTAHAVQLANYGSPEIVKNNYGQVIPFAAADAAGSTAGGGSATAPTPRAIAGPMVPYYPDSEAVLYPLVVNGKAVYDSNGTKVGISVEVNVRYKKVANVDGLQLQQYESSSYTAITDAATIISMAEHPPFFPINYGPVNGGSATDAKEIDLDTPSMAYVQVYQYNNATNEDDQFLVPAFVFPVINATTSPVVVPLIQDFVQAKNPVEIMNNTGGGVPPPSAATTPAQ